MKGLSNVPFLCISSPSLICIKHMLHGKEFINSIVIKCARYFRCIYFQCIIFLSSHENIYPIVQISKLGVQKMKSFS